jgi:hypothetical protein
MSFRKWILKKPMSKQSPVPAQTSVGLAGDRLRHSRRPVTVDTHMPLSPGQQAKPGAPGSLAPSHAAHAGHEVLGLRPRPAGLRQLAGVPCPDACGTQPAFRQTRVHPARTRSRTERRSDPDHAGGACRSPRRWSSATASHRTLGTATDVFVHLRRPVRGTARARRVLREITHRHGALAGARPSRLLGKRGAARFAYRCASHHPDRVRRKPPWCPGAHPRTRRRTSPRSR